ncbi:MAG: 2-amino-4-hydroxy-6-hydroxymethyldihydropteridine diphosphokinase [Alphaproteobacteria bacterium]|nr:2-amino-4-hydroxy-6-hydroxymethyldihydropteridine diphosphokinase [Alphaproteobacteria bacterium]
MPPLILIGLGANLDSPVWGSPRQTLTAALAALEAEGMATLARSGWYRSAPVPPSEQPWFINAVVLVATPLDARDLLALMQKTETAFGRVRAERNAARVLDLDLLDYCGERIQTPELILPHPRMHQRRFVLEPLAEVAPQWRHPILGLTAEQLLAVLDQGQPIERLSC